MKKKKFKTFLGANEKIYKTPNVLSQRSLENIFQIGWKNYVQILEKTRDFFFTFFLLKFLKILMKIIFDKKLKKMEPFLSRKNFGIFLAREFFFKVLQFKKKKILKN